MHTKESRQAVQQLGRLGYQPAGFTGRGHLRLAHPLLGEQRYLVLGMRHGAGRGSRGMHNLLAEGRRELATAETRWESMQQRLHEGEALGRIVEDVAHAEGVAHDTVRNGFLRWQRLNGQRAIQLDKGRPYTERSLQLMALVAARLREHHEPLLEATLVVAAAEKTERAKLARRFQTWVARERLAGRDPVPGLDELLVDAMTPPVSPNGVVAATPEAEQQNGAVVELEAIGREQPPEPEPEPEPESKRKREVAAEVAVFEELRLRVVAGQKLEHAARELAPLLGRKPGGLLQAYRAWLKQPEPPRPPRAEVPEPPPAPEPEPERPQPEPVAHLNGAPAEPLTSREQRDLVQAMRELLLPDMEAERDLAVEALKSARRALREGQAALLQSQQALDEISAALEQLTSEDVGVEAVLG